MLGIMLWFAKSGQSYSLERRSKAQRQHKHGYFVTKERTLLLSSKRAGNLTGQNRAHSIGDSRGGKSNTGTFDLMAVEFARTLIDLPSGELTAANYDRLPVFLGHGEADDGVSAALARQAARTLRDLGLDVTLKRYAGLGHWWRNGGEFDKIVDFLTVRCGVAALGLEGLNA